MHALSPPRAVIFDFDGTLTDPDSAAARFRSTFFESVGLHSSVAADRWRRALEAIDATTIEPDVSLDGVAVARSDADPWLLATGVARAALAAAGVGPEAIEAAIREGFHRAYASSPCAFRPGVGALLDGLARRCTLAVVSNSPPDRVRARLAESGADAKTLDALLVVGGAQKFALIASESAHGSQWRRAIGASRVWEGAPRPVALGRGRYLDAIAAVCAQAACTPGELVVCGDVFELDLAVPIALGARACMVAHSGARPWERTAVERHGGAVFIDRAPALDALLGASP